MRRHCQVDPKAVVVPPARYSFINEYLALPRCFSLLLLSLPSPYMVFIRGTLFCWLATPLPRTHMDPHLSRRSAE
jgi:hypothetical protein